MKVIGLIGGMSWESTVPYYRLINEGVKARLGGLHSAKIVLYSVDFAEIERLQHRGDWDEAGALLADAARALERAGVFRGRYHVLGGVLSALDGVGPDELGIPRLAARVVDEGVTEVILALNATVEGQTTAHYIADALAESGAQISTLAQGVPIGGELDYLDDGTLGAALRARRRV